MRFVCQTLFDITATGITGHFKSTRIPHHDRAGQPIADQSDWNRSRNQQRNWETVLQCLGLRTQPMNILGPKMMEMFIDEHTFGEMYYGHQRVWCWTFNIESEGIWKEGTDPLALLHKDFNEVPVIQGLDETARFILPIFYTNGAIKNVFFKLGRLDLNSI